MRRWKWRIASRVSRDFQGGYLTQPTSPPVIDLPLPVIKSLSGGKQAFVLDVRFFADFVRFSPKSGRIDTVTVESARDPGCVKTNSEARARNIDSRNCRHRQ